MLVAVVGAGVAGCAAIKNCLEEGLEVVAFEREPTVGGLWRKKDVPDVTTVMDTTMTNFSKHRMALSDFVFPDDTPLFPLASDMVSFIESYAKHFNLLSKIKFNTTITSIDFYPSDSDGQRFIIKYHEKLSGDFLNHDAEAIVSGEKEQEIIVNRIMLATGLHSHPKFPDIPGMENFRGETLHSRSFRTGAPYKGKKVLVVGSRSSAADACTALVDGGAEEVLMSHRGGVVLTPRVWRGVPFDFLLTRRLALIQAFAERVKTYASGWILNKAISVVERTSFKIKKEWGFSPRPDVRASVPTMTDTLVPLLHSGQVVPIAGIDFILPDSTIVLTDGTHISDIDAIIFATGFRSDLAANVPLSPDILTRVGYKPEDPHRLLQYKFTLTTHLPELVFLTQSYALFGAPISLEIRSMWSAAVWSGHVKLPVKEEMIKDSEKDLNWLDGLSKFGSVTPGTIPIDVVLDLAAEAGCASDHLYWFSGSSIEGWRWWWKNRTLSRLILDGPDLPSSFRVRGRKRWDGAENVIRKANGLA